MPHNIKKRHAEFFPNLALAFLFVIVLICTPQILFEFYCHGSFVHYLTIIKTAFFIALPLALTAYLISKARMNNSLKHTMLTVIYYYSLAVYTVILSFVLFGGSRRDYDYSYLLPNFIPFSSIIKDLKSISLHNFRPAIGIIGNAALFLPLAFLISWKLKNKRIILLILMGIIVLAELAQQVFIVGVFDIDDIILNSIGGMGGVLLQKRISNILAKNAFRIDNEPDRNV